MRCVPINPSHLSRGTQLGCSIKPYPSIRHIGPMAQDFHLIGFGEDDKHISTVDAEGVSVMAIQGQYQIVREKDDRIKSQQQEITALKPEFSSPSGGPPRTGAKIRRLECPLTKA